MELKDRLRDLREGKNLTQKEIASELGVKYENYNKWENGKCPNLETLCKIADYYGITVDYLVGRKNIPISGLDLGAMSMATGLSTSALNILLNRTGTMLKVDEVDGKRVESIVEDAGTPELMLSQIIEHKYFPKFLNSIIDLKYYKEIHMQGKEPLTSVMPESEVYRFCFNRSVDIYREILEDILPIQRRRATQEDIDAWTGRQPYKKPDAVSHTDSEKLIPDTP